MFAHFHGHMDSLVLCQRKRLQRAQYALLVYGLKVYGHGVSIVPGALSLADASEKRLRFFSSRAPE